MSHVLDVEGHRLDPWGVGGVGRMVAYGPGGPRDGGLCLLGRGGCPLLALKRSSPLAGLGASSFWCFSLLPRAPALGFGLVAAVTPCVGLSEGFLGLFGACCHGSQLQSLAGWEARQEEVGHVPACREEALGFSFWWWGPLRPRTHSVLLGGQLLLLLGGQKRLEMGKAS